MKSIEKKINILVILGMFIALIIISNLTFSIDQGNSNRDMQIRDKKVLKSAGYWNLTGSPITINGNSGWAIINSTHDWCNGEGTLDNPYVIENVTIDGRGGLCINISNSNVYFIIKNCTLYNGSYGLHLNSVFNGRLINNNCFNNTLMGIYFHLSHNNTLSGNILTNNGYGIYIDNSNYNNISGNIADKNNALGSYFHLSHNNTLSGNILTNNGYGIYIDNSNNNNLSGNNASNNIQIGIYVSYSNNNTVSGNTASNNALSGIFIDHSNSNNISGNNVNNSMFGIYISDSNYNNISGNTASNNAQYGIYIWYSNYNNISGNIASNNDQYGIYISDSNYNNISGNIADNNIFGIDLHYSNNNTVSGNKASTNDQHGIYIGDCNNNTFLENIAHNNDQYGIYIRDSNYNNISGNIADNNIFGIDLYYSNNNTVSGNTASTNALSGIFIGDCNNNTFLENIADNNIIYGIYLRDSHYNNISGNIASNNGDYGIYLMQSNYNDIFCNFLNDNSDSIGELNSIGNLIVFNLENGFLQPLLIDDNGLGDFTWAQAVKYGYLWFSGSGSWSDPYIFKNGAINGKGSDNCIIIRDSDAFFIIRNCTFINSGGDQNAGIKLIRVKNGFIKNNKIINNQIGILINDSCGYNTFSGNIISNNIETGIYIEAGNRQNLVYNNTFNNNGLHAYSNDIHNYWDNGSLGNYWDNYDGEDANDDGIGDREYQILEFSRDNYPIFEDGDDIAPKIDILFPWNNSKFGEESPSFHISIYDYYSINASWYRIIGHGSDTLFEGDSVYIDPALWNTIPDGIVIVQFNANDTVGHLRSVNLYIIKDTFDSRQDLNLNIIKQSFSLEHFNLTFFVSDETELGIDSALIQMWWNENDVSDDVINLGNGFYFVSLVSITVALGEDPILLSMIISADGYQDKYFETYIAVDPDTLDKEGERPAEEFPLAIIIIAITSIAGGIGVAGVIFALLRKRKRASEVI